MKLRNLALPLVALLVLSFAFAPTASAHKTTYTTDDKIKVVWGFLNEPAVTWTKTGIDLLLFDNVTGAPINGAADTLEAHLKIGNDELHLDDLRAQHGKPGAYTQVVTLTKPGIYMLALHGTINGSAIDMEIPSAHEIHSVDETFFPKVSESPYAAGDYDDSALVAKITALETAVAALQAKAQTQSTTPATMTPQQTPANDAPTLGLLFVALAIVGAAFVLRRKA